MKEDVDFRFAQWVEDVGLELPVQGEDKPVERFEWVVLGEVLCRDVTGHFVVQPDKAGCILPKQLRANACEVQIRQHPGQAVETGPL